MNPPGRIEDLKNYILREIPRTSFMDFGLLYKNVEGEYVLALFTLARIACLLHFCVKTSRLYIYGGG